MQISFIPAETRTGGRQVDGFMPPFDARMSVWLALLAPLFFTINPFIHANHNGEKTQTSPAPLC